ncbi:hypothetical protein KPH14_012218 [Odynerus spinipes]|uniref:BED-type domain-containing protein n=1 Tax=Odynerus spinipes TaxID=1348599 RepID=A0AAD9VL87_9HYME|nr:hypothetical protein KPH14_012218 [Odynerus spinipes]
MLGNINTINDQTSIPVKRKRVQVSSVWKYFKRSNDKKLAKCINCGREYKTSGNTTNLGDHLRRHHPLVENSEFKEQEATIDTTGSFNSQSTSSSTCSSIRSISPFFKRALQYDANSQRKLQIDKVLIEMIALDYQPFTIVKDIGFRKLINLLDLRYVLVSTYTLSGKLLENCYQEVHQKLKNDLADTKYVAITTDSWTSCVSESYLTVTCHYINKNLELKSGVLSTKLLANGVNHTAENIAESLATIFTEWNIGEKVTCIVTDNASNMIKTCGLLKKRHLPCYAHTLNLVVQENFDCIKTAIKKCKDIVTFIKTSNVAMEIFKKEIEVEDSTTYKQYKLIQEVPTRWNSAFNMIERILKTNETINRTLLKVRKAPQPFSVDELSILNDSVKVLKCFEEATKKVSGNNYVTISLVIPLTFGIYNFLTTVITDLDTEEGKIFCSGLIKPVQKRLFQYESRTVTKLGTILDRRFKEEGLKREENALSAAAILKQEMYAVSQRNTQKIANRDTEEGNLVTQNINNVKSSPSLFAFLEDRVSGKIKSITADVIIIKRQYLERPNSSHNSDPLLF